MSVKLDTKMKKEPIRIGPISPKQELVFQRATEVDFMIIGGSRGGGKSEVITQIPLIWKDDPRFSATFIRTELGQLMGSEGLWDKASKYYPLFNAKSKLHPNPMYIFPSGAKIRYKQIANQSDAEKQRGSGHSAILCDECTQNDKESVQFLLTCLRSEAKMNSIFIGTCNPDKNSWVFDTVEWYLDDRGYVDPEKNGAIRFYVVKDARFIFADEESWFLENMPETVTNSIDGSYIPPKKFCFVQLTIFDNPVLLQNNPRYLSELQNLPEHERESQLYGCWFATADKVPYWDRVSVRGPEGEKVVSAVPVNSMKVCAWDKAGTEYIPKLNNTDADFTASVHLAKCKDGYFYMYGNYCPENYDPYEKVYGKFRKSVGERDRIMLKQAEYDGKEVPVLISRDAGSDGGQVFQEMAKKFVTAGFKVVPSTTPVTQSKWSKFEPFLMACQAGLVRVVESSFDKDTLEMIYKELENFAPTLPNGKPWRSGRRFKDDICDSFAEAYNYLSRAQYIPSFSLPSMTKSNEFNF